MNRDKQIEEMAKIIDGYCEGGCLDGCYNCVPYKNAEQLYNAGYRKASEVIEDVFLVLDKRTEDEGLVFVKKSTLKSTLIEWREKKKVEIAREIFEEIEEIAMHGVTPFGLCLMSMGEAAFAELKKKYESEGEG